LNGIGGEDSDLGDPIYAIADGRVLLARDGGQGWGNVIILLHAYIEDGERKYVQSYYGHAGDDVRRGQQIATVDESVRWRTRDCSIHQGYGHVHFRQHNALKVSPVPEQVNPVQREQSDG